MRSTGLRVFLFALRREVLEDPLHCAFAGYDEGFYSPYGERS